MWALEPAVVGQVVQFTSQAAAHIDLVVLAAAPIDLVVPAAVHIDLVVPAAVHIDLAAPAADHHEYQELLVIQKVQLYR